MLSPEQIERFTGDTASRFKIGAEHAGALAKFLRESTGQFHPKMRIKSEAEQQTDLREELESVNEAQQILAKTLDSLSRLARDRLWHPLWEMPNRLPGLIGPATFPSQPTASLLHHPLLVQRRGFALRFGQRLLSFGGGGGRAMQRIQKSEQSHLSRAELVFALVVFATASGSPTEARTITFDPAGSVYTSPAAINASKWIAGWFEDSGSLVHSFLRLPQGEITTFDADGDTCGGTQASGINASGMIVGDEGDSNCNYHGFERTTDGTITILDVPHASDTEAFGISDGGLITGSYQDSSGYSHGFLRATDGTFTSFDPPGSIVTSADCINAAGTIAGFYADNSRVSHGFVRAPDGSIKVFDPPNATDTIVTGINKSGEISGYYLERSSTYGFVRAAGGKISTIDVDGSNSVMAFAINDDGSVVGSYSTDTSHGFVRAADGTIRTFSVKGSKGTNPIAVNGKGAITGSFDDGNEVNVRGFLRSP